MYFGAGSFIGPRHSELDDSGRVLPQRFLLRPGLLPRGDRRNRLAAQTQITDARTGECAMDVIEGDEIFTLIGEKKTKAIS